MVEVLTSNLAQVGRSVVWPASRRALLYLGLLAGALITVGPFLWMLSIAVSSPNEVFSWPPKLIPSEVRLSNFADALRVTGLSRYLLNSFIVATVTTLSVVIIDSMAGYAFAKLRFPGRRGLFIVILSTIMIPVQVTVIPLFLIFKHAPLSGGNSLLGVGGTGLLNTYQALIVPGLATTLGIYLMRQFFRMLPGALLDAARVDGLSEFAIFRRIYLPLAKPALAAVAIFNFTWAWNDFLIPLIMTSTNDMFTLQVGLTTYRGHFGTDWPLLMAGVTMTTLPIFFVYFIGQKYFVRGIALTGIRG